MTIIYDTSATTIPVPYTITSTDASNIIISQPVSQTGYYMCNFFIEFNPDGNNADNTNYLSAFVCNTNDFNTASSNVNNWYNTVNIYPQYWGTRSCKSCYISTILYLVQGDTISGCFKAFQNQQIISAYLQFMIINIEVIVSNGLISGAISNTIDGQPFSVFTTSSLTNGIYFFENYLSYSTNQQPYYVFSAISTTDPLTGGFNILNVNNTVNVYTSSTNQTMIRGTHNSSIIDISNNNNVYGIGQTGANNQTLNAGWLNYYLFNNFSIIYTKNENFSPFITINNSNPIDVLSYNISQTGVYYCEGGITYNINTTTNIPLYVCISDISATSSSFTIDSNYSTVNNIYTRASSSETNFRGCRTTFLLNLNEGDTIYLIGQADSGTEIPYATLQLSLYTQFLIANDVSYDLCANFINTDISYTLDLSTTSNISGDLIYSITSLPPDGSLNTIDGSAINSVPFILEPSGNNKVSFIPPNNYIGQSDFSYNVSYNDDVFDLSSNASVFITVEPVAENIDLSGIPDTSINFTLQATDSTDVSYSFTFTELPNIGNIYTQTDNSLVFIDISYNTNNFSYLTYQYSQNDLSFSYFASTTGFNNTNEAQGILRLLFDASDTYVDVSASFIEKDTYSPIYLNYSGVNETFYITSIPNQGKLYSTSSVEITNNNIPFELSNNLVYYLSPNDYIGNTDFSFVIQDNNLYSSASCFITVEPVAENIDLSGIQDISINFTLQATDSTDVSYSFTFTELPAYGSIYTQTDNSLVDIDISYNNSNYYFLSNTGFFGSDQFKFFASTNGFNNTNEATGNIEIKKEYYYYYNNFIVTDEPLTVYEDASYFLAYVNQNTIIDFYYQIKDVSCMIIGGGGKGAGEPSGNIYDSGGGGGGGSSVLVNIDYTNLKPNSDIFPYPYQLESIIGQGAQRNVESYSSSSKLIGISNKILVEASGGINASDASGGYGGVFFIDSSLTLIYGGNGGNGGEASTYFQNVNGKTPPYSGNSSIFGIDTSNIQNSIFPDVSGLTTYDVSNLLYSGCGAGGGGGYGESSYGPTDAGGGFPGGQYSTNSPLSSDQSYNYTAPGLLSGGGDGITATIYGCGGSGCSGVGTPGDSGGSGANGVVVFWFLKVENPVYPIPDPDLINISITANNDQDSKNYLIPLGVSGEFPISYEIIYSIDSLPDEGSLSYKGNQILSPELPYFLDINNNFVTYTPNNYYLGKTDFLYSIYAFVNGTVQKPGNQGSCLINISPITQDVSYSTLKNQSVNIEMNPTGLNNYDYLTVFPKLPDYGEIYILNSNNEVNQFQAYNGIDFRYQPGLDYTGKDTFSYYCIKNNDPSYNYTNTSTGEITIDENPVPVPQSKIRCNYKRFNCNNYSKNLPSSSGNIVVPQKTAAMQYARDIRIQTYFKGAKWQLVPEKVNEFGRKAGGPGGYGGPPKNNF